jgi:hypothetical protein
MIPFVLAPTAVGADLFQRAQVGVIHAVDPLPFLPRRDRATILTVALGMVRPQAAPVPQVAPRSQIGAWPL